MFRRSTLAVLFLLPIAACAQMAAQPMLSPSDIAEVARAQQYLNSIRTLRASFVQVWPNGATSQGTLWMDRPGRLRLQYAPPSTLALVTADGTVLLYDASNQASTTLPLAETPLSIILAPTINLSGPVTVMGVQNDAAQLSVTVAQTAAPQQGSLTLVFSRTPFALQYIRMVDAGGGVTQLSLFDVTPNVPVNPSLFDL